MSARDGGTGRGYMSVGGEWLTTRTAGPDDESPVQMTSHLGCDLCYLNISHTVDRCAQERGRS